MQWMKILNETKIVYIKINNYKELWNKRRSLINSALYNGMKIKTTAGCWINPETCETEKVLRVELLSEPKRKMKKETKISERDMTIANLHDNGLTLTDLATAYGMSKQRISQIIKRVKEFSKENQDEKV